MKKIITTLAVTLALIGQNLQGAETYKTLVVNAATPTATYNITAGELCHVVFLLNGYTTTPLLEATIQGTTFKLHGQDSNKFGGFRYGSQAQFEPRNMMIAGPATITLTRIGSQDNFCTLRLFPTTNIGGVKQ